MSAVVLEMGTTVTIEVTQYEKALDAADSQMDRFDTSRADMATFVSAGHDVPGWGSQSAARWVC